MSYYLANHCNHLLRLGQGLVIADVCLNLIECQLSKLLFRTTMQIKAIACQGQGRECLYLIECQLSEVLCHFTMQIIAIACQGVGQGLVIADVCLYLIECQLSEVVRLFTMQIIAMACQSQGRGRLWQKIVYFRMRINEVNNQVVLSLNHCNRLLGIEQGLVIADVCLYMIECQLSKLLCRTTLQIIAIAS